MAESTGRVGVPRLVSRTGQYVSREKIGSLLDLCVSSLRRGHANLLCIVPILADDLLRDSTCRTAEGFKGQNHEADNCYHDIQNKILGAFQKSA